jgi:hypothetical protein
MVTDIKDYISRSRESGVSDNVIKTALINLGHSRAEIEQAYAAVVGVQAKESESYFAPNTNIQFGNQPAVPTAEQVAQEELVVTQGKKKTKKIITIVIAVFVIFGFAASGFAYYNYVQNNPKNVIAKFNLAWPQMKSFRSKTTFAYLFKASPQSEKQSEIKLESVGTFDFTTSTGTRFTSDIKVISEFLGNLSPIGLKATYLKDYFYLQSWDFSKFPFADLSSLDGVWIRMNEESIDSSGESFGFEVNSERLDGAGDRFKDAMKNPPATFVKELPGEVIGELNTYHYLFNLDLAKLEDFFGEVGSLTAEELAQVKEERQKRYENITTSTIDLWIYKGSYMPAKFLVTLEGKGADGSSDSLKIENIFSDINVPLTISEPNNYKDLQTVFEDVMKKATEKTLNSSTTEMMSTSSATSTSGAVIPAKKK